MSKGWPISGVGEFYYDRAEWTLDTVTAHPLTEGVSSVHVNAGGWCTGGQ